MKKVLMLPILAAAMLLAGCVPLMSAMLGGAGPPPQAPAAVTQISRTAIDFALNSFDAALYGVDFAIDAHMLTPGSDTSRRVAAAGRRVMAALGVADAAQRLGSSATYEEAFANAKTALDEFRQLLPAHPAAALEGGPRPPLTDAQRMAILERLERPTPI
jgi:hypothetical protein